MNHTYRLIWNEAAQRHVPASELTCCRSKRGGRAVLVRYALLLAAAVLAAGGDRAHAGPTGGTVITGQGTIKQTGDTTTVQQQSQNLSLDWQSFNIARSETVQFLQPSSTAVAVNRVIGSDPSHIYGHLSSNGQVFLINPNGVLFGRTAQVNVGSLVASTLNLTNSDILTGHYTFQSANSGSGAAAAPASVINRGTITASEGGSVALLGGQVSNQGIISARFGTVALAAGSAITLDFNGNRLMNVQVDEGAAGALAENRQLIQADGGTVIMTARAYDALLNTVVNNTGVIEARTIQNQGGEISLLGGADGGTVSVDGTLDASAPDGGNGGLIETSGAHVHVADSARISTLATSGNSGTWLIDPADYTVAATNGDITGAALGANLQTGNVTILSTQGTVNASGSGDINVNDAVTWTSGTRLTLNAINSVNINAAITNTGSPAGGGVTLRADTNAVCVAGTASCGTVTFSGSGHVTAAATDIYYNPAGSHAVADANGNGPSYSSPTDYATNVTGTINASMLVNDVNQLQAINTNQGGTYALGRDINASVTRGWNTGAGFVPIGSSTTRFTGRFDGQGHTISGLFINLPLQDDVGLFGMASNSTIRHVGLIGADITGSKYVGALAGSTGGIADDVYATSFSVTALDSYVGGLVGYNNSALTNAYATGVIKGNNGVGGLVGFNANSLSGVHAAGTVTGNDYVGGLVGYNNLQATITGAYATGTVTGHDSVGGLVGYNDTVPITGSYATGDVGGNNYVGGLVGYNWGALSSSYASGSVNGNSAVGGLAGYDFISATVSSSYATGSVTGATQVGGLVGWNRGTVNFSYATGSVAGGSAVGGLVGYNFGGQIQSTYATGRVTGNASLGGLIGTSSGSVTKSFWDTDTSGQSSSAGGTGQSTANLLTQSTYTGWDFANTWFMVDGSTRPFLRSEYSTTINNAHQLQLMQLDLNANYTLANDIDMSELRRPSGLWNSSRGFVPIGSRPTAFFTGRFDGQGHTISGLFINLPRSNLGLFGKTNNATIRHVGLIGADITGTQYYVGALAGETVGGIVDDVYATSVSVTGLSQYVGGLVGFNGSALSNAYATGAVSGSSYYVGGLVGYNSSPLSGVHATCTVTGGADYVGGLVGYSGQSTTGAYATGRVTGRDYVGGLVGLNLGDTIAGSYASGAVSGTNNVGGLVGANYRTVSSSYASGSVTGTNNVGGLVGNNFTSSQPATVSDSYATGSVAGGSKVGGLVGLNSGQVQSTYATGRVTGSTSLGGLIGKQSSGSVTASFWDTDTSGQSSSAGGTGKTSRELQQLSTFSNWSISGSGGSNAIWRIYEGYTAPLLRSFMTNLTVAVDNVSTTYNGTAQPTSIAYNAGGADRSLIFTDNTSYRNAGSYNLGSRVYSNQQGYDISYSGGTMNIARANLTLTTQDVVKTYDGTTSANGVVAVASGTLYDSLAGGTFAFTDKNAGTGKTVTVGGVTVNDGNGGNNYTVSYANNTTSTINAATLTVGGAVAAADKVYDATRDASVSGGVLSGVIGSDSVNLRQSGQFADKNVGTNKAVTATFSLTGADAGNYVLLEPTNLTASISKANLTVTGLAASDKVYDTTTADTLTGTAKVTALGSDVVALSGKGVGSFAGKNVGNGKAVTVSGYTLTGADAGNYTLVEPTGLTANITPSAIKISGLAANDKVYDGLTAATLSGTATVTALGSDTVLLSGTGVGSFANKKAGNGKAITVSGYSLTGADASNYTLVQPTGLKANITPARLTITANDQTKVAGMANPALTVTYNGFVAGESASSLTTAPTVWTAATTSSPAGNYAIKVSGTDDVNYNISYIAGTLNVTSNPLGITGTPGYVGAVGSAGSASAGSSAGSTGQIDRGGFVGGPTASHKESDADESEIYDGMLDIDTPKKVTEALPILSLIVLDKGIRLPNGVQ